MLANYMAIDWLDREISWFKFILHDILLNTPLDTAINNIISSLFYNNHELTFILAPRWLIIDRTKDTTKKNGTPRAASELVITLIGNHSLLSLGLS